MTLNILMLSTLFPDMSRPNFGVFVERQARELASRAEAHVTVIAPIGMPPWPLSNAARYAPLRALPKRHGAGAACCSMAEKQAPDPDDGRHHRRTMATSR